MSPLQLESQDPSLKKVIGDIYKAIIGLSVVSLAALYLGSMSYYRLYIE